MSELAWLIILEVTYRQAAMGAVAPWRSRHLHYTLMTQPIRKEPGVVFVDAI